jgi:catechol 2,3-dioxygenase-like lactoylglutathione lyase family enzyme
MPETEGVGSAQQISFLVDSLAELRAMHKRATSAGHKIMYTTCHGNAWSFYFRDHNGNRVEVYTHSRCGYPGYFPNPLPAICRRI